MSARPPRVAMLLMQVLLPSALREAISGDLEEEWNASRHPSRLRFWYLAMRSVVVGLRRPNPGASLRRRIASPVRYHETMRIPLVEGRFFDSRDSAEGAPVALVNQTLARRYLGGRSAVGRRVQLGRAPDAPWLTIVGVIGDVRHSMLTDDPDPEVYVPMAQAPNAMMMLAIRSDTRPENLSGAARAEIQAIDPALPVYHVKTLESLVDDSMLTRSASMAVMTLFSALALVLAAVGIYGVVAYGVSQQRREFAVRLALGATPRDLRRLVLRSGLMMVGAGMAFGLAGALSLSRLMTSALYGVSPADPLTYSSVVGFLAVTSLFACGVPAWRASATPPGGGTPVRLRPGYRSTIERVLCTHICIATRSDTPARITPDR